MPTSCLSSSFPALRTLSLSVCVNDIRMLLIDAIESATFDEVKVAFLHSDPILCTRPTHGEDRTGELTLGGNV